jgi:hypothetical protein
MDGRGNATILSKITTACQSTVVNPLLVYYSMLAPMSMTNLRTDGTSFLFRSYAGHEDV